MSADQADAVLSRISAERRRIEIFMNGVEDFFLNHEQLSRGHPVVIHSVKKRFKSEDHIRDKIARKATAGVQITTENIFREITDLAGVRVIHMFMDDFKRIHDAILGRIADGDWHFHENPKAYTWDPEYVGQFEALGLQTERKESFYTSVHYVLKPRTDTFICCEVQVRTLFEEIWGEVDHLINCPHPTRDLACHEQIRVLAKLIGAGTRLLDSVYRISGGKSPFGAKGTS